MFPRKLWVMTTNALMHSDMGMKRMTQQDLILDPLQVLRCDRRVFRAGPVMEIVLYVLKAFLAASRTHLTQHLQDNPIIDRAGAGNVVAVNGNNNGGGSLSSQVTSDVEREELKNALIGTQESAAMQILLEAGLPLEGTEEEETTTTLSDLKEIQSLICLYLHEAFIADPTLAKLVHFQASWADVVAVYSLENNFSSSLATTGISAGASSRDGGGSAVDAHLPGLCSGTLGTARSGQADVRRRSHLSPLRPVRAAKVLLHRQAGRERSLHAAARYNNHDFF